MVAIRRSSRAVLNIFLVYNYEQREEFIPNGYPEVFGKAVKETARHKAQKWFAEIWQPHVKISIILHSRAHRLYLGNVFVVFSKCTIK